MVGTLSGVLGTQDKDLKNPVWQDRSIKSKLRENLSQLLGFDPASTQGQHDRTHTRWSLSIARHDMDVSRRPADRPSSFWLLSDQV